MLRNGIPAGTGQDNLSYIGSPEESLAKNHIHANELTRAANINYAEGRQHGYEEGKQHGYDEGWEKAVAAGNEQIRLQAAHTRRHIQEKEALKAQLDERVELIGKLITRIEALEAENQALQNESAQQKKTNIELRELVTELRSTTVRLQEQVSELDAKYKSRTQQYADLLWQYNRTMVVVSAVSNVLDELTKENTVQARAARELFTRHYAQEVRTGLERGTIRVAPDLDPSFKRMLPKTQALISDLLTGTDAALVMQGQEKKKLDSGFKSVVHW